MSKPILSKAAQKTAAAGAESEASSSPGIGWRWPPYYGWVNLLAAAAMVAATLPGRTHGLGMMTRPLLEELEIENLTYGWMNFGAVLLGSLFGVPLGRFFDRRGARAALSVMTLLLGLTTLWTAFIRDAASLFVTLTLARGLAQAGLTAGGVALVGIWFRRRLGYAMSAYSIAMGGCFVVSVLIVGSALPAFGWRFTWLGMGLALSCVFAPLLALVVRSRPPPNEHELSVSPKSAAAPAERALELHLGQALGAPTFWVFTLAYAIYTFSWTAVTLFNEVILAERGLGPEVFVLMLISLPVGGAVAQVFVGWLVNRHRVGLAMALGMLLLGASMAWFPFLTARWHAVLYAVGIGAGASFTMVSHMAFYPQAFGRVHLGQIQGAAQVIAVIISGLGPVALEFCKQRSGNYAALFFLSAAIMFALGAAAYLLPMPRSKYR